MAKKLKDSEVKLMFAEVVRGYTKVASYDFGLIYVKHINTFDSADIESERMLYENKAIEMGVLSEEEYAKLLEKDGTWTSKDEDKIAQNKVMLKNLEKTKSKLHLKSQVDQVKKQIKKVEENLLKLNSEKRAIFSNTVEGYGNKKVNEYYMRLSTYADEYLEKKKFTNEEFDELEDDQMQELIAVYNVAVSKFVSHNQQLVALSPLFLNFFYLCDDNAVNFYGKPIVELSFYQAELFGHGIRFKSILSDSKSKPPDDIAEDPEKLIEWADVNKNAEEIMSKGGADDSREGMATSLVGATQEDLKHLGIDPKAEGISLQKAASKKGGSLNMEDLMKLHGV